MNMNPEKSHLSLSLIFIVFSGVLAAILMSWITVYGIGISIDSTRYIEIANNILAGSGFIGHDGPATHYPPMYPLTLAIVSFFGQDPLQAIQGLHIFLFGLNVVLFGVTVYICTNQNMFATALAFFVLFSSEAVLLVHAYAWSESLFITFTLAGFLLISLYLTSFPRLGFLLLASIFLGLAIISRYVGLATIPPVLFGLLYFGKRPLKRKIIDAAVAISIMVMPLLLWLIRNGGSENAVDRMISVHPINIAHLSRLATTLTSFILPVALPGWIKIIILGIITIVLLAVLFVLRKRKILSADHDRVGIVYSTLAIVFAVAYIAVVLATIAFLDASTPLDSRILSPIFVFLSIAVIVLFLALANSMHRPSIWIAFTTCVLVLVALNVNAAAVTALDLSTNGIGYNSRKWNTSKTLALLKTLDRDIKVYSNLAEVVRYKTGIQATYFPEKVNPGLLIANPNYLKQLNQMCKETEQGAAYIVFFYGADFMWELPSEKDLKVNCELPIWKKFGDGFVAGVK